MHHSLSYSTSLHRRYVGALRTPRTCAPVQRCRPLWMVRAEPQDKPDGDFESLFSKELQRRGLSSMDEPGSPPNASGSTTPGTNPFAESRTSSSGTSSSGSSTTGGSNSTTRTRARAPPPPMASNAAPATDQRQKSMDMVNEGLEGLIPRATRLLQLGGSLFLGFLPFMIAFSLLFTGVYFVFGPNFVHGGRPVTSSSSNGSGTNRPSYIDPERLLSEPTVDPYIPFNSNPYSSPDLN
ncbi:hypothetical protein Agub_g13924 [Astrephomene gubernaculifera]|uniref:Transmembrane protein n=1 Tax=Astrephomene gubernaculifera TaxID=47775 RepID=A0AAD3E0Q8_9CHLO|nr:hypothetical protein Agub_g13924 [Astrephomene gubernaculifera]